MDELVVDLIFQIGGRRSLRDEGARLRPDVALD